MKWPIIINAFDNHMPFLKPKEKSSTSAVPVTQNVNSRLVLKRPSASERANRLSSLNKYVFFVESNSNKNLVMRDIENRYNVKVLSVNILNIKGKPKKWRNRIVKGSDYKKAIVTLKEGDKIEIN